MSHTNEPVFALIENGHVAVYPLHLSDLNERDNPNEVYYRCYFDIEPDHNPLLQCLEHRPRIVGEAVLVLFTVKSFTVHDKFNDLIQIAGTGQNDESGLPVIDLTKVPMELIGVIEHVIRDQLQKDLDAFALTRQYDDIKSLVGYVSSDNLTYRTEALRGRYFQDTTWDNATIYFEKVLSGQMHIPRSYSEFKQYAEIPEYTWLNER